MLSDAVFTVPPPSVCSYKGVADTSVPLRGYSSRRGVIKQFVVYVLEMCALTPFQKDIAGVRFFKLIRLTVHLEPLRCGGCMQHLIYAVYYQYLGYRARISNTCITYIGLQ